VTTIERHETTIQATATRALPPQEPPVVRDRYLDVLGALALVQIVTLHTFGWSWLPYVFPAMGVLFAVAGAVVAGSLDRAEHRPWHVLKRRTLRILPPLWLLGLVLVPVMLVQAGWSPGRGWGAMPLDAGGLLNWLIPLGSPPATEWGQALTFPVWFVSVSLWFLLLSPAFLWMFRRWPKRTMSLPLGAVVLAWAGVLSIGGDAEPGAALLATMATFGACWLLGFAHHDGTLARVPKGIVVPLALGLLGIAAVRAQGLDGALLDRHGLTAAFYCLGFVLLVLRLRPSLTWLRRRPLLNRVVTGFGARGVTIYLWINPAIYLAGILVAAGTLPGWMTAGEAGRAATTYLAAWVLLAVAVVGFGWVEDLGARRTPRLLPARNVYQPVRDASVAARGTAMAAPMRARAVAGALVMLAAAALVTALWWGDDDYQPVPDVERGGEVPGLVERGVLDGWRGGVTGDPAQPSGPGSAALTSTGEPRAEDSSQPTVVDTSPFRGEPGGRSGEDVPPGVFGPSADGPGPDSESSTSGRATSATERQARSTGGSTASPSDTPPRPGQPGTGASPAPGPTPPQQTPAPAPAPQPDPEPAPGPQPGPAPETPAASEPPPAPAPSPTAPAPEPLPDPVEDLIVPSLTEGPP
jgi:peptidoglycan/LPS O-acetylase OafA/YrhL